MQNSPDVLRQDLCNFFDAPLHRLLHTPLVFFFFNQLQKRKLSRNTAHYSQDFSREFEEAALEKPSFPIIQGIHQILER